MQWKAIRLELAASGEFPRGSCSRSYLVKLPLAPGGTIDRAGLEQEPARAIARRFWPRQPDMIGTVVLDEGGFAIRYESAATDQLYRIAVERLELGCEVKVADPDGTELPFRVASLKNAA